MQQSAAAVLGTWSNFYVITGSAAAALTGLVFVVITLVAGGSAGSSREGVATFSTPTVVHFGTVLFVSALMSAPWRSLTHAGVILALTGVCGIIYIVRVTQRARRGPDSAYQPDFEDWLWYSALPIGAYVVLAGAAIGLAAAPSTALFALAAGVLLLIFIGIHNAWDVVTYIAVQLAAAKDAKRTDERSSSHAQPTPEEFADRP